MTQEVNYLQEDDINNILPKNGRIVFSDLELHFTMYIRNNGWVPAIEKLDDDEYRLVISKFEVGDIIFEDMSKALIYNQACKYICDSLKEKVRYELEISYGDCEFNEAITIEFDTLEKANKASKILMESPDVLSADVTKKEIK